MARRLFFSFHYDRDVWRVQNVRQSWRFADLELPVFYNATQWEDVTNGGDEAIQEFIDNGLARASCTVLLVGRETHTREWVDYEIQKSYQTEKGLVAINIHNIKNQSQDTDFKGLNPLSKFTIKQNGQDVRLSQIFKEYDWVNNNGRDNIATWVEEAVSIRKGLG